MVQLKVYPNTDKVQSQQVFLDLYDSVPIKLTLSIEDITDADATSVFSRTFKIPANRHNNTFFETAFEIDGTDYNVTIKKPAEILVDGSEFRQGHIRLQKIYINKDLDKTDYELLFLGETRDFSSVIGDAPLCELVMPDVYITDVNGNVVNPTKETVEDSWQAFPQSASVDGNGFPNGGVNSGNIIFPLIDHGNSYNDQGELLQADINIGQNNTTDRSFIHSQYALPVNRLKPMIRAKRIWDQIFQDAGYTYSSDFIDSSRFHQMYVSAFGNNAETEYSVEASSLNLFSAANLDNGSGNNWNTDGDRLWLPDNVVDPGGNFTVGTNPIGGGTGSYYTAPATAAGGSAVKYTMQASAYVFAVREISCPQFCTEPVAMRLQIKNLTTGQVIKQSYPGYDTIVSVSLDTELENITISAGDVLYLEADPMGSTVYESRVHTIDWQITAAPGSFNPVGNLDCNYKQIDFIKDILKVFRLVLAPDPAVSNNFIVEPWQTYINSGNLHDWSHKLVQNKDQVLEPLFNNQSEEIDYTMQQDEDFINKFHFDQFKNVYGHLKFDSNNDLLKGTRTVETLELAPTPLGTIYEDTTANHQIPGFILPLIHANEPSDTGNQRIPIRPKTRLLFYNGLVPIPLSGNSQQEEWYLGSSASSNSFTSYPLVSPYESWPQTTNGLNLNFSNDVSYWNDASTNNIFDVDGTTLYTEYWSRYISSLYGQFSRRLTAYFVLNNVDLQTFSFDDTIFVNGKYFRPEKIIDVNIGERTEVKVQLITANDFTPPAYIDDALTNFSLATTDPLCGCDGIITVTTDGASPFSWTLSNGQSGSAISTGANPQQFDIDGICAGAYNVEVVDDIGRTGNGTVNMGAATNTPITSTVTTVPDTSCGQPSGSCNGEATVTPQGGTPPYTVYWQYGQPGPTIGNTLTGQCGNTIQPYYIQDSLGCISEPASVTIPCGQPTTIHKLARHINCNSSSSQFVYAESTQSYAPGTTVDLVQLSGCYAVVNYDVGQPVYTIANSYADCQTCEGITPPQMIELTSCPPPGVVTTPIIKWANASDNPGLEIGLSVKITGYEECFEATSLAYNNNTAETVETSYTTCAECNESGLTLYTIESCSGSDPDSPPPSGGTLLIGGSVAGTRKTIGPMRSVFRTGYGGSVNICDAQGLFGRSIDDSGWYYFAPQLNLETNPSAGLPADTQLSLVKMDGASNGSNILETIYTVLFSTIGTLGAGDINSGTFTTPLSYYAEEGEAFGWVIHRDAGQPDFPDPTCSNIPTEWAVQRDSTQNGMIIPNMYYLGDNPHGNVMSTTGTFNINDIVTVNEINGCYEVVGLAQPDAQVDYTYNEAGGVFQDCIQCTGGAKEQYCHTITGTSTPAVFKWVYDDGSGQAAYTLTLNSGQSANICALVNSPALLSGTGTIVDSGELCFETTWGTTCDTQPTPIRECYVLTGIAGPGTSISEFNWFENNLSYSERLKPGETLDICADVNTPNLIFGAGTITSSGTTCTSTLDCSVTCFTYTYTGFKYEDLWYVDCDGNNQYVVDVFRDVDQLTQQLPYCILQILGGSAVPFMTQNAPCT